MAASRSAAASTANNSLPRIPKFRSLAPAAKPTGAGWEKFGLRVDPTVRPTYVPRRELDGFLAFWPDLPLIDIVDAAHARSSSAKSEFAQRQWALRIRHRTKPRASAMSPGTDCAGRLSPWPGAMPQLLRGFLSQSRRRAIANLT